MTTRFPYRRCSAQTDGTGTDSPFFRRLSNFAQLNPIDRDALWAALRSSRRFPTNGDLIVEGLPAPFDYIIEGGWACSYKLLKDGRRQILNLLLPGDHVAQSSVLSANPTCSVSALTPLFARSCRSFSFEALQRRYGKLKQAMNGVMQLEMASLRDHLVNLGRRDAYQRLAHLILELDCRLRMVGYADKSGFELPITQETIADALGLSHVHVNRTLRRLSEDNVARFHHNRLTIFDRNSLSEIAEFDESYLGRFVRAHGRGNQGDRLSGGALQRRWSNRTVAPSKTPWASAGEFS